MQLTFHVETRYRYWGAIHGMLGQRFVKKQHLPSEKIGVFKYFRRKLAGEKLSAAENFGPGQLRPCQCS